MTERIRYPEVVEPGTLVRSVYGHVVYEVIETRYGHWYGWLSAMLRDTRTGKSVGWRLLHSYVRVEEE